jgi:phosphate-selective porin OprO/OprP
MPGFPYSWRPVAAVVLLCPPAKSLAALDYDAIWDHATLYENTGDGLIRDVALSGRLQAEAYWFSGDIDEDDVLWRRFRFGFVSNLANSWKAQLEADFDLNESSGDWYNRLTDAYIGWKPNDTTQLKILKHSAGFTLDGATSSKKLLALQRNNLTNNLWFTAEYFTGVSLAGDTAGNWFYKAGLFSSDGDDEISAFSAGYFALGSLGYDWSEALAMDKARVRLDLVHNEEDEDNNTRDLSTVVSLTSQWERGSWGMWTDLGYGDGYFDQSDLWGLAVMPFYNQSDLVQWVFRYTYIDSDDPNGVRFGRYEREIVRGTDERGNRYEEAYLGLNLFFYGHKLKWQTGLQYAHMDDVTEPDGSSADHEGWGITTGLRISW